MLKTMICLPVLVALPLAAAAGQKPGLPAVAATLKQAVLDGDAAAIKDARAACLTMLDEAPAAADVPLLRYTVAYADWKLSFLPSVSDQDQEKMLEDGQTRLMAAKHDEPLFADELVLLYAVDGARINRNMDLAMSLGPDAANALANAEAAAPSNPRVILMQGIALLYTPAEYGGDPHRAIAQLRGAVKAFDAVPADAPWPNWGRFDAHVALGEALAQQGDTAAARAEYKAALEIAPKNDWVKEMLAALK